MVPKIYDSQSPMFFSLSISSVEDDPAIGLDIIGANSEKHIFHLRAPSQLDLFKGSSFARASLSNMHSAQYTTCGWVAAYLAHDLCKILAENNMLLKQEIQQKLMQSPADEFIRSSTQFVGDLTPFGGSADKVEGLLLGSDIFEILNGTQPPAWENVFVIEGATELDDLQINIGNLTVFNSAGSFQANYNNPIEFFPLKNAINEVAFGTRPFVILVSLETFPLGQHFVTYTFRKDPQGDIECLIFEGLNEAHDDWLLLSDTPSSSELQVSTTEWIYKELMSSASTL